MYIRLYKHVYMRPCMFVYSLIARSAFCAFIWLRFCISVIDGLRPERSLQTENVVAAFLVVSPDALHCISLVYIPYE